MIKEKEKLIKKIKSAIQDYCYEYEDPTFEADVEINVYEEIVYVGIKDK